jgi:predicted nucleotidyltransferase
MDYYQKYQKYKFKYYNLLNQSGSSFGSSSSFGSGSKLDINEIKNAIKNGKKLKEINEKYMNKLTPEQYFDICKIAVTSNLSDFEDVLHMEMEAKQYLDKKAKEFNANFQVTEEGAVSYHFDV